MPLLSPSLRTKRFRFLLASRGHDSGEPSHNFTFSPAAASVSAAPPAAPSTPHTSAPAAEGGGSRSGGWGDGGRRRSGRSCASIFSPLTRTCRSASAMRDNSDSPRLGRGGIRDDGDRFDGYSSACTLIVSPASLVDHWRFQIKEHTRDGVLRVLEVTKSSHMLPGKL